MYHYCIIGIIHWNIFHFTLGMFELSHRLNICSHNEQLYQEIMLVPTTHLKVKIIKRANCRVKQFDSKADMDEDRTKYELHAVA